jgi:hypothetical protein
MLTVYKDPQKEDIKEYLIHPIKKIGESLPFQLEQKSEKKDKIFILEHYLGEIKEKYTTNGFPVGAIRLFSKRKLFKVGCVTSGQIGSKVHKPKYLEENDFTLVDTFLKVNGKEIY